MERFYRNHLVDKMDFAAALQKAQVWVRELSIGEVAAYAAQCYWQSTQKEEEKKRAAQIHASLSLPGRAESNLASVCKPPLLGSVHGQRMVSPIPLIRRFWHHYSANFYAGRAQHED